MSKLVNNYCWKFECPATLLESIAKDKKSALERMRLELAQGILDGSYDDCFKFEDVDKVKPMCYQPLDAESFMRDAVITIHNAMKGEYTGL